MLLDKFKNFFLVIKEIIWPIKKEELKLFLPMALMMLCILFNFGSLRSIKDGLIIPSIGAEVISFLKLWLVLPSSVIFTILYVKLSNKFNFEHIFYIIVTCFLVFFLLFAFIIYPHPDLYHPSTDTIKSLSLQHPNFQWFIKIAGNWSYALMYVFSELWSVVVINLMFWQFANHIFSIENAKRLYPILGMIGNLGLIIAGNVLVKFSNAEQVTWSEMSEDLSFQYQSEMMLKPLIVIIVCAGILAMILFRIINRIILVNNSAELGVQQITSGTKTKLSISESLKLIITSKYIGHIVLLILCYGLLINILEGPWKSKVRELYPNTIDYINFMGRFNIWMGISCVTFMIIGSNILRKVSWLTSALLTPLMLGTTGLIFFTFVIFSNNIPFDPLYVAVIVGAIQNILSKSTKYSLFDSTKEMAYIPLPLELKTKGKAAVEVIGLKFGKSLGAFIQSSIFIFMPTATFDSIGIYLMITFIVVITIWVWDVVKLNREYLKLCN